jgi:hypothetical protein
MELSNAQITELFHVAFLDVLSKRLVAESSKPKQTATTRRWKVGIEVSGRSELVRTKIEFSNRNGEERYRLEAIPSRIVAPYALRSPSVQHYTEDAPTEQKVRALASRPELEEAK